MMIEIKTEMWPAEPAKEAIPARVKGSIVELDGCQIHWDAKQGAIYCYSNDWYKHPLTSADIRKFSAILTDIADTLDAQEKR